ncbi:hypothetical protein [Ideonella paludis]|uniref:hypothetical protein n=1 Tax=Ideonella paludis TaxID=1233411 RepID=UPI00362E25A3
MAVVKAVLQGFHIALHSAGFGQGFGHGVGMAVTLVECRGEPAQGFAETGGVGAGLRGRGGHMAQHALKAFGHAGGGVGVDVGHMPVK